MDRKWDFCSNKVIFKEPSAKNWLKISWRLLHLSGPASNLCCLIHFWSNTDSSYISCCWWYRPDTYSSTNIRIGWKTRAKVFEIEMKNLWKTFRKSDKLREKILSKRFKGRLSPWSQICVKNVCTAVCLSCIMNDIMEITIEAGRWGVEKNKRERASDSEWVIYYVSTKKSYF